VKIKKHKNKDKKMMTKINPIGMTESSPPRSGKHKQTPTAKEKSRQRFLKETITE
jgi:hypothetical protein